jgi:hypothetical protein
MVIVCLYQLDKLKYGGVGGLIGPAVGKQSGRQEDNNEKNATKWNVY